MPVGFIEARNPPVEARAPRSGIALRLPPVARQSPAAPESGRRRPAARSRGGRAPRPAAPPPQTPPSPSPDRAASTRRPAPAPGAAPDPRAPLRRASMNSSRAFSRSLRRGVLRILRRRSAAPAWRTRGQRQLRQRAVVACAQLHRALQADFRLLPVEAVQPRVALVRYASRIRSADATYHCARLSAGLAAVGHAGRCRRARPRLPQSATR